MAKKKPRTSQRQVESSVRRAALLQRKREGATQMELAREFGISRRRVQQLLAEELERLNMLRLDQTEAIRQQSYERIERIIGAHLDKAYEGDMEAGKAVVDWTCRAGKLFGWESAQKFEGKLAAVVANSADLIEYARTQGIDLSRFAPPMLEAMKPGNQEEPLPAR